jgi:alpha-L-rhamnosidase
MSTNTDGTNHIVGAIVGEGWFSGRIGSGLYTNFTGGPKQIVVQLRIDRNDGSLTNIVTDTNWTCDTSGPIQGASIWDGETYDARQAASILNWSVFSYTGEPTYFTTAVTTNPLNAAQMATQPTDPIQIIEYLHPVDMWTNTDGGQFVRIFDMGQNMAGWCTLTLTNTTQPAGTAIHVHHAETLALDPQTEQQLRGADVDDSSLSTLGRKALQTETYYVLNNSVAQQFQPHFTYHGFRYVRVDAPPGIALDTNSIVGCVIRSSVPVTGAFSCSHPDVNRLMTNIMWTLKANLYGIETDCPQRNEREGWLGDSDAFSQTACFNMDMAAFYTKCIRDIRDEQWEPTYNSTYFYSGAYYVNNPATGGAPGDIGWETGGVIKPWQLYQNYADARMVEEHYLSASNWVNFLWTNYPSYLILGGVWEPDADWANLDKYSFPPLNWSTGWAQVRPDVHGMCFYAYSADILANMSRVLQVQAQAKGDAAAATAYGNNFAYYTNLATNVRSNFQKSANGLVSYDANGNLVAVGYKTQADYVHALYFNMIPDSQRSNCMYQLLNDGDRGILHYNHRFSASSTNHFSTGVQATGRLMSELTRNGYTTKAYELLTDYRFPSWLYQITNGGPYGATTLWEHWNGWVSGSQQGYCPNGLGNSFNHFWTGAVGEWIYRNLAGIAPDDNSPGFQNVIINPQPGGAVTNATASFASIHGPIWLSWTNDTLGANFYLNVGVPANASANVYLPSTNLAVITESGLPVTNAPGVLGSTQVTNGAAVFRVGSGSYSFSVPGVTF